MAYFSPLSPVSSGISDYSEELLPHLAQFATIDIFVDGYSPTNKDITAHFEVHDACDFEHMLSKKKYDTQVYQVGNSTSHTFMHKTLSEHPGVTVLHDYVLHHSVAEMTLGRGDPLAYIREMGFSHGLKGIQAAVDAVTNNRYQLLDYPANGRVLESSLGVIVLNNYSLQKVKAERPWLNVCQINHHGFALTLPPEKDAREILSLEENELVLGSFGFVTPEKRLDVVLRAFKRVREHFPTAMFIVVGEIPGWYSLQSVVEDLELQHSVRLVGRAEMYLFQLYMAATDICVNLRYPTMGETSGSLIRILGAARPAIVSNTGWFGELPDECCKKVDVNELEEESLVSRILELAHDPIARKRLGETARSYIKAEHRIEDSAAAYISFIESVLASQT